MKPDELMSAVKDPDAWRLQSSTMRRSAEALWDKFLETVLAAMGTGVTDDALFEVSMQYMQTSKLLYGLALETAFKALIVANSPQDIDLRVSMDGTGKLNDVEVRSLGVPSGKGHDLVALAEKAGVNSDLKLIQWGCGVKLGLIYAVNPRLSRYSSGLSEPRDILMRFSLYQRM